MFGIIGATLLLAFREIMRHILRSILTTLGIIIGVAAVITMVTLGNGVTASIQQQISSLGSNVYIIFPVSGDRGAARPFQEEDIEAVRNQIAGVEEAAGSVSTGATAFYNGADWSTEIQGVESPFLKARSITIEEGRPFTREEEEAGRSVCLIGLKVKDALFIGDEDDPLGAQLRLNNVSCTIVGVLAPLGQSGGASGQDQDNTVMMPLKTVQRRFIGNNNLQYFVVRYSSRYDSAAMQDSLIELLRERRLLSDDGENDFNIIDTAQVNEALGAATGALTAMVTVIAGISLLVGGIGIMNIMLVSVTERTREIGIRLAIGALSREVRLQFLTEAVVLCSLGGLVGIALAFLLSWSIASAIEVPFIFSPMINLLSFLFAAFLGIVFGYYPAARASKLDPIEALRHE